MANYRISRALSDAALYSFHNKLEYKAKTAGVPIVEADRFFPSSKLCRRCGWKNNLLELGDRTWTCRACHAKHERDFNTATNRDDAVAANHSETINAGGEDALSGSSVKPEPYVRRGNATPHNAHT